MCPPLSRRHPCLDLDTGDEVPLGEMLSGNHHDPSTHASRLIDWEQFLEGHDEKYAVFIGDMLEGKRAMDTAQRYGRTPTWAHGLKQKLSNDLRDYFGEEAIAYSMKLPGWRGGLHADKEKVACGAERRRE